MINFKQIKTKKIAEIFREMNFDCTISIYDETVFIDIEPDCVLMSNTQKMMITARRRR